MNGRVDEELRALVDIKIGTPGKGPSKLIAV